MSRTQYGLICGIAGAASLAAYWWTHRRNWVANRMSESGSRGETIFSNAPIA